ncbi:MAG TPA: L,D-transpeptidase [Mycobacteriales bacterium]|nr:L,D-transpeptidase [Mycobacteriales bacterium]
MTSAKWRSRRWLRSTSAILPVIAVVVLVISVLAVGRGGTPAKGADRHTRSLASLLTRGEHSLHSRSRGSHRPGAHRDVGPVRSSTHGANTQTTSSGYASWRPRGKDRFAPARDVALAPHTQVIANLPHATKGYPGRNSLMSNRKVPASWYGHRSALPVVAATPDRLLVRLAQRPNGATTWIDRDEAVLRVTHWAVVIDVSRHFLYAFYNGVQEYAFPVGNGTSRTPTPTGQFFVAFHATSNGPGYGPVNIATSAHSTVFRSFDGGDDAIIAIHGPIGSDAAIGNHGAAISNGCIRMHLDDLAQVVRHVPDGAPVIITR